MHECRSNIILYYAKDVIDSSVKALKFLQYDLADVGEKHVSTTLVLECLSYASQSLTSKESHERVFTSLQVILLCLIEINKYLKNQQSSSLVNLGNIQILLSQVLKDSITHRRPDTHVAAYAFWFKHFENVEKVVRLLYDFYNNSI